MCVQNTWHTGELGKELFSSFGRTIVDFDDSLKWLWNDMKTNSSKVFLNDDSAK